MNALSWKPVRRGAIYCAPACGGGCKHADYIAAAKLGERIRKQLRGRGWKVRLNENLGWFVHVELVTPFSKIDVTPSQFSKPEMYHAMISDSPDSAGGSGIWHTTKWFEGPQDAVDNALAEANRVVESLVLAVESINE